MTFKQIDLQLRRSAERVYVWKLVLVSTFSGLNLSGDAICAEGI